MKVAVSPVRLWCMFALAILLTRSMQFAFPAAPPDATLAVLLLGGMWIRRWPGFVGLMAAAFAADWIATGTLGVPDFCFSPAYAGLVPAYLAAWGCGWWLQRRWPQASLGGSAATPPREKRGGDLLAWLAAALVASASAFTISNAFWYAFSESFAGWSVARFSVNVLPYFASYASATLAYVALAWALRLAARYSARLRSPEPAAE
jgi:hypothetical protein